jgi:hypothetical protein
MGPAGLAGRYQNATLRRFATATAAQAAMKTEWIDYKQGSSLARAGCSVN